MPRTSPWQSHRSAIRAASIAAILLGLWLLARTLPLAEAESLLRALTDRLGPWGMLALGAIYVLATVLMVPGAPLTLVAGGLYGLVWGTVIVSLASTTGAGLAFLIARYALRGSLRRRLKSSPKLAAIDRAIGERGGRLVALLRLSPLLPFNLSNYAYGLTRVGFWPYLLASWIGMLPGTFLYIYIGHAARAGALSTTSPVEPTGRLAMLIVGLIATLAGIWYISRIARRAIRDATADAAPTDAPDATPAEKGGRGWALGLWVAAGLLVLGLGCAATAQPGLVDRVVGRLFGPPALVMQETYAPDPDGPSVDHSRFDAILAAHVDDAGMVDYQALSADPAELDAYIATIAHVPLADLGRDERLALLINAYNAFTLKLITEHYPIDSIRDIPADQRWDAVRWRVGPETWSLNQIEHEQIRPHFIEPRIHFALVCAAWSCPKLRAQAYTADRLDAQLQAQTTWVHARERWLVWQPDTGTLRLSRLYQWYGSDFTQVAPSVTAYAAQFRPDLDPDAVQTLDFLPYSWDLNDQASASVAPR